MFINSPQYYKHIFYIIAVRNMFHIIWYTGQENAKTTFNIFYNFSLAMKEYIIY